MKNILLKVLCGILLSLFSNNSFSQDIHFSQFFETPLLRNPALAGLFSGDVRLQGVYRTQWGSITVPYQTGSFNGEFKLPIGKGNDFLSVGGQILYDKAGTVALTSTHILPVANFHKSLSNVKNMYLSVGFMGGLVQRKLDQTKITTNSQYNGTGYDPTLSNGESFTNPGYSYIDGSAGISFNSQLGANVDDNIYFGVAYHHFNKASKISFYNNAKIEMIPKWVVSAGIRRNVSDRSFVTLQGDYSKQGTSNETIGGMIYSYKLDSDPDFATHVFHAGAIIRWKDAIIPVVKMEYKPFTVAVSYDINVSQLKTASQNRGGFELSITYQTSRTRDDQDVRCPRF